jgi:preprotein translocase subunit SecB
MQPFPLQLKQSVIREVVCKAAPGPEFASAVNLTCNPTFARGDDDPKQWQITLSVHFKASDGESKPLQYTGHIDLMGIFLMAEGPSEEVTLRIIAINGPSLLYATARETLAFLTSRGPHGAYLLPTITFADVTLAVKEAAKSKTEPGHEKAISKTRAR